MAVHAAGGGEGDVELLHDIDKDLLAARVLLAVGLQDAPDHGGVPGLPREDRPALSRRHNNRRLIENKGFQGLGGSVLRKAIVDRLVQQLVDDDEVLPDGLLTEHADVILDDVAHADEQLQDHRWRHVCLRGRHNHHAAALHVEVCHSIDLEDGRRLPGFVSVPKLHLPEEYLRARLRHVAQKVTDDDRVPSGRENEELRNHGGLSCLPV
mmetsp:Transcript_32797/g.93068  ORF Transcript_32797/g.93068 Transcript_32797/m.93068 type:complete len:210 (+) Transcript_32797:891-1520(+)